MGTGKKAGKSSKKPKIEPGMLKAAADTNFIRKWRMFRNIASQGDLSALTVAAGKRLTRATISRLESGAMSYRQWQLEALARALDCTPGDLLSIDPFAQPAIFKIYMRLRKAANTPPPPRRAAGDQISRRAGSAIPLSCP